MSTLDGCHVVSRNPAMPTTPIDSALRARIDAFTSEITALVRASALEAVHQALGGTLATAPAKRGPGRPAKSGAPSPIAAPKRRGRPGKRTPEDVAKMGEAVVA